MAISKTQTVSVNLALINNSVVVTSKTLSTSQIGATTFLSGPVTDLAIGTVNTVPYGTNASATVTGTAPTKVLNLTLPQGAPGSGTVTSVAGKTGVVTLVEGDVTNLTSDLAARAYALNPTSVKTAPYTLAANDYVPVDTTAGAVTLTLPSAPANGTRVGAKMIAQGGTNTVTITRGGTDVFNKVGGNTSVTITLLNQSVQFQYSGGIWYGVAADIGITALDARYQATLVSGTTIKTINSTSLLGSGDIAISGSVSAATPTANGSVKQTQYNVRDYSAVGDGTTDDTTAIQNAINAAATAGGGVVIFPLGTFLTGTLTLKDTVSLMGTSFNSILKLKASAGTLIISENFATAAGSGNSFSGIKRLFIRDLTFNGNSANQTDSAASDYRGRNAIIKLYAWNYSLYNVHINDAKEIGLYTEHDNDWNGEGFNETTFGESTFEQIYIKNYGQVGWVHRGPHDSHVKSVYVSSYNASGLTAVYGVVAQTNGTSHYGSQGLIADNLHVWGEHSQNAILLDSTNIVQGKIYAEGSTLSAVKIQNSTKNYFHLFAGYATNAVEIAGCNDNTIEVTIESNISGSAFLLTGSASGNDCRHITGTGAGSLFNMTTYTGANNVFRSGRPYNATLFGSTTPATTDRVDVISDNFPDSGRVTRWELPIAATKVKFTSAGLDLGGLPITNTSTTLGGSGSGITRSVSTVSGATTAGSTAAVDYVYNVTATATITLPTAIGNTNRYTITNANTGTTVTIATTSSQTINGSTTAVFSTQYTSYDLISDGANWIIR